MLKITPALTLVVLARVRQWRAVAAAGLVAVAVVASTLPLVGRDAWVQGSLAAVRSPRADAGWRSLTGLVYALTDAPTIVPQLLIALPIVLLTLWRAPAVPLRLALAASMFVPFIVARIVWDYHAVILLPALALLWAHTPRTRVLAVVSWFGLTLIGGYAMPVLLPICWAACLWPVFFGHPKPGPDLHHG